MLFSPTVVFCPHKGVADALHTIEYGLEANPPWGRVTGWIGPTPENFFLNDAHPVLGERGSSVLPSIPSQDTAGEFYFSMRLKPEPLGFSLSWKEMKMGQTLTMQS
jgi:hypothetical protein